MDVHDVGLYRVDGASRVLEPGMVLTVEPGLYIAPDDDEVPDSFRGIGIRIEDDVLVTADGHEVMTLATPNDRRRRSADYCAVVNSIVQPSMTGAAISFASYCAITYFVSAIVFVVTTEFAELVVAIALVLAFRLRVIASIGASRGEHDATATSRTLALTSASLTVRGRWRCRRLFWFRRPYRTILQLRRVSVCPRDDARRSSPSDR